MMTEESDEPDEKVPAGKSNLNVMKFASDRKKNMPFSEKKL